jgi:hypothetical protein
MINVTIGESKTQESKPFPKLMQADNGLIVLFTAKDVGTVIFEGNSTHKCGYVSHNWFDPDFRDFKGAITIQNS